MRHFTKQHNDINWLFPVLKSPYSATSEYWFDEYEKLGQNLLEFAYPNQESFTKDDMMDAFMKGCSEAQQFSVSEFARVDSLSKFKENDDDIDKKVMEIQLDAGEALYKEAMKLFKYMEENKNPLKDYKNYLYRVIHQLGSIFKTENSEKD